MADRGQQSLWLRQVAVPNSEVQIIPPSSAWYSRLAFSPDGNYLYYLGGRQAPSGLYRVPVLGGAPAKLVDDVDSSPTFAPDGRQMAYVRGNPDRNETTLVVAGPDGSGERTLATLHGPRERFTLPAGPSWSPDGKRIVGSVSVADGDGEYQELMDVRVSDGAVHYITNRRWLQIGRTAWQANGRRVLAIAADRETTLAQVWSIDYPGGGATRITNDLDDYRDLSLTADARVMAVLQSAQQSNVWLTDGSSNQPLRITSGNHDGIDALAWARDGGLVYSALSSGAQTLWIADREGGRPAPLTDGGGSDGAVAAAPDADRFIFASTRNGGQHLWSIDSDRQPRQLTSGIRDGSPVFSPDGQWLAYRSYSLGLPNLFRLSSRGGSPARLTERISGSPAISPDGRWIACTYRETALSPVTIAILPSGGGPPSMILAPLDAPVRSLVRWTNDGRAVMYIRTVSGVSNIWQQPLNGGAAASVTHFDSDQLFNFTPAGRTGQIAVARGRVTNDVVLVSVP
jgi:Tol biopolymer transport system component